MALSISDVYVSYRQVYSIEALHDPLVPRNLCSKLQPEALCKEYCTKALVVRAWKSVTTPRSSTVTGVELPSLFSRSNNEAVNN